MADIYQADGTPCALVANPATTTHLPPSSNTRVGESQMLVLDLATQPPTMNRNLTGATGASGELLRDLAGNLGIFFAFPDLSVRTEGAYRLMFSFTLLPE